MLLATNLLCAFVAFFQTSIQFWPPCPLFVDQSEFVSWSARLRLHFKVLFLTSAWVAGLSVSLLWPVDKGVHLHCFKFHLSLIETFLTSWSPVIIGRSMQAISAALFTMRLEILSEKWLAYCASPARVLHSRFSSSLTRLLTLAPSDKSILKDPLGFSWPVILSSPLRITHRKVFCHTFPFLKQRVSAFSTIWFRGNSAQGGINKTWPRIRHPDTESRLIFELLSYHLLKVPNYVTAVKRLTSGLGFVFNQGYLPRIGDHSVQQGTFCF